MRHLEILEQIELDFLQNVNSNLEERKKLLPIMEKNRIYSLIWNLFTGKYLSQISYKDYTKIMDILINRLK